MINRNNNLTLTTSPLTQPARKPCGTANLGHRQRFLYGRKRRYSTGKERDIETGLYYYGARYLDSRTGRWLSGDPALGDYVPEAPINDEARKRNKNLPGQGGVFNYVNLHVYHYAGNNPVKYIDPDGRQQDRRGDGFVRAAPRENNVLYFRVDNSGVERSGGTRAWRNNNPGNIRRATNQIGLAGGFAVFADYETGFQAIIDLLQTDSYNSLSINDAITRYAPPTENDTANYQSMIAQMTGLDTERTINSLTADELNIVALAIQRIEGYAVGNETPFPQPREVP